MKKSKTQVAANERGSTRIEDNKLVEETRN
jgi:hypothetical protein